MSFVANFTASQGSDCTTVIITDTSDYSNEHKNTFSSRKLYMYKADGTTIKFPSNSTTDYIDFSFSTYPQDQISINVIDQDYCLRVELVLTSTNPQNGSVYTKTSVVTLTCYTNTFLYNVAQIAATNPARINDPVFYQSWSDLQTEKDAAIAAGSYADQLSSEAALRRAENIINESNLRF